MYKQKFTSYSPREKRDFNQKPFRQGVQNDQIKQQLQELFKASLPDNQNNTTDQPDNNRMSFVEQIQRESVPVHSKRRKSLRTIGELSVMLVNLKDLILEMNGIENFSNITSLPESRVRELLSGEAVLGEHLVFHIEESCGKPGKLTQGLSLENEKDLDVSIDNSEIVEKSDLEIEKERLCQKYKEPAPLKELESPAPEMHILDVKIDSEHNSKKVSYLDEAGRKVLRTSKLIKDTSDNETIIKSNLNSKKGKNMSDAEKEISLRRINNLDEVLSERGMKALLCRSMGYADSFLSFMKAGKTSLNDSLQEVIESLCGLPSGYLDQKTPIAVDKSAIRRRLTRAKELALSMDMNFQNRKEITDKILRSLDGKEYQVSEIDNESNGLEGVAVTQENDEKSVTLSFTDKGEEIKPNLESVSEVKAYVKEEAPKEPTLVVNEAKSAPVKNKPATSSLVKLQAEMLRELADRLESGAIDPAKGRQISLMLMSIEN